MRSSCRDRPAAPGNDEALIMCGLNNAATRLRANRAAEG
jgi:hypothetical protein